MFPSYSYKDDVDLQVDECIYIPGTARSDDRVANVNFPFFNNACISCLMIDEVVEKPGSICLDVGSTIVGSTLKLFMTSTELIIMICLLLLQVYGKCGDNSTGNSE